MGVWAVAHTDGTVVLQAIPQELQGQSPSLCCNPERDIDAVPLIDEPRWRAPFKVRLFPVGPKHRKMQFLL